MARNCGMSADSASWSRLSSFAAFCSFSSSRPAALSSNSAEARTRSIDWAWSLSVLAPSSFQNRLLSRPDVRSLFFGAIFGTRSRYAAFPTPPRARVSVRDTPGPDGRKRTLAEGSNFPHSGVARRPPRSLMESDTFTPSVDWSNELLASSLWVLKISGITAIGVLVVLVLLGRLTEWGRQFWRINGPYFTARESRV